MSERPSSSGNRSLSGWLKFIAIGMSGYVVLTLGVIALVELAGWGKRLSYAVAIMVVMCGNFDANRRFVYPQSKQRNKTSQAARFVFFALLFRVLEFYSFSWLIGPIGMNYVLALTVTSAVGYPIKYYVFSIWVFR